LGGRASGSRAISGPKKSLRGGRGGVPGEENTRTRSKGTNLECNEVGVNIKNGIYRQSRVEDFPKLINSCKWVTKKVGCK